MLVSKISLTREDLKAIVEAMDKFPDAPHMKLVFDDSNDSGYTLSAAITTTINDLTGEFIVPIVSILN